MPSAAVKQKWRPSLALVIGMVCALLIALPVIGVLAARLTSNQFVRETERSLLAQAAIFAEAYALAFETQGHEPAIGTFVSAEVRDRLESTYHPVEPSLSVFNGSVLPPRPDPQPSMRPIRAPYDKIGGPLSNLAARSKKTTLAGYVAVDAFGRVIAASGVGVGYSLGHVEEVQAALEGRVATVLRYRTDQKNRHPLTSISRDTSYRVFVAHPVVVGDRVVGAVHLSRTPVDLPKFLFAERHTLAWIAAIMIGGAAVTGFLFWRLISHPIRALRRQSQKVASGAQPAPEPLRHYGIAELADLGGSVLSMARTLTDRSDAIESYTAHVTHELKSPVTSIVGAAELLESGGETMTDGRRRKLYRNIQEEGRRMDALLGRLRELARARIMDGREHTRLSQILRRLREQYTEVEIVDHVAPDLTLPLPEEQAQIVLSHLIQNSAQAGAGRVEISYDASSKNLLVRDDGNGISAGNRAKVLEPFFTTRRDDGGTGMGLSIVAALLEKHGATLKIGVAEKGASISIQFQ